MTELLYYTSSNWLTIWLPTHKYSSIHFIYLFRILNWYNTVINDSTHNGKEL